MPSRNPSSKLEQLIKLSKRKETLLAQIQDIDRDMVRLEREFRRSPEQTTGKARLTISTAPGKRRRSRTIPGKRAR